MSDLNDYPGLKLTEEERRAWLKSLKAGDVVADERRAGSALVWKKVTVERVTPTGRIKVRDGSGHVHDYGCGGFLRSGEYWSSSTQTIVPWVDAFQARMDRRKLVGSVMYYLDRSNVDREKVAAMPDDELYTLRNLLRKFRQEKPQ